MSNIKNILFPENSIRRKTVRVVARTIKGFKPSNIKKFVRNVKEMGFHNAIKDFSSSLFTDYRFIKDNAHPYPSWILNNEPTEKELLKQRKHKFKIEPKISIVVPLYNTPVNFFNELVDCLINQTYSNWELCLADGSENQNEEIITITKKDNRIKYFFIGENKNISGNTNEALKLATGDYIGLLDHDDLLPIFALYEIVKTINQHPDVEFIYSDEDKIDSDSITRYDAYFKSDFSPESLETINYICHFSIFKKELMSKLGGFREKYNGAQDHDIILRMTEETNKIIHIPKILYHWRVHQASTAMAPEAKPYAYNSGIACVQDHLKRLGIKANVYFGKTPGSYKINFDIIGNPKIDIIIANKNNFNKLKNCIDSILKRTTYENFEIYIIENNSTDKNIFKYYKELQKNPKIKILNYSEKNFNYSKIINFGINNSNGDYIITLHSDTKILTNNWIEEMLGYCQRNDIGAVGVKSYYPDDTYEHAGIVLGMTGIVGYRFRNYKKDMHGYFAKELMLENVSAVSGTCMMFSRKNYEEVSFMNEKLSIAYNDIDFCLKLRKIGKRIIFNPFVEIIHDKSKEQNFSNNIEIEKTFHKEEKIFKKKWKKVLKQTDEYFNPNLRTDINTLDINPSKIIYKPKKSSHF